MSLKNDRLIRALLRQHVDTTPVWIMRQAGRYLPEYREVRAKAGSFMNLCKTPELACEVTLQPLRRFDLDAAIIFSDILTIPDAMGLGLDFIEGEGPRFAKPIQTVQDISALKIPDVQHQLNYVFQAIQLVKKELNNRVPLIGFSGSPWTLATYMIENGSKSFNKIKKLIFNEAKHMHYLLQVLSDSVTQYLNAQIEAGVDVVMIFDTWGGILTPQDYKEFSLNYMSKIIQHLLREYENKKIPVILFTKNGGQWLELMAQSQCDALGLDWTINIGDARKRVGDRVALQGNMDPAILYATPERIQKEVVTILKNYGSDNIGHIFNLGHGINPDTSWENVKVLVDAVHKGIK